MKWEVISLGRCTGKIRFRPFDKLNTNTGSNIGADLVGIYGAPAGMSNNESNWVRRKWKWKGVSDTSPSKTDLYFDNSFWHLTIWNWSLFWPPSWPLILTTHWDTSPSEIYLYFDPLFSPLIKTPHHPKLIPILTPHVYFLTQEAVQGEILFSFSFYPWGISITV